MKIQQPISPRPSTIKTIFAMSARVFSSEISIETLVQKTIQQQLIDADKHSYDKAISIASQIPEIAKFIANNKVTNIYASIYEDLWIVEFYSQGNPQYSG
ncbi:MAG: hypothetical protein GF308_04830 [Candidatus Heimdallarchaeota archaeon]|nr:hypothetical protein [Candidatus Heimdallarchaeota archaeon]